MSSSNKISVPTQVAPPSKGSGARVKKPLMGSITEVIGTGEDAQHSIVYATITWCFAAGLAFSLIVLVYRFSVGSENVVDDVKSVWAIFVPIITLALGYLFGKGQK